jgi:CarD family transcriptional regulator
MTKKSANDNKTFKKSDYVVYPAHGVGRVVGVEKESVAGFDIEVYVVAFDQDKMILRVPTNRAEASGMRALAGQAG